MLHSELLTRAGFVHAFSTQDDGSFPLGEEPTRIALLEKLHAEGMQICEAQQVHGTKVMEVGDDDLSSEKADALVSSRRGVLVGVRTADCVPVLLASVEPRAVAAVHAGWRGSVSNIVQAAVQRLRRAYGVDPAKLYAALGPHIGPCCFEVGPEVMQQVESAAQAVHVKAEARTRFADLGALIKGQLISQGLVPTHIENVGACTRCHPTEFYSFRRDKEHAGRHLSLIGIR